MNSDEIYAEALKLFARAKATLDPLQQHVLRDDAHKLITEAKELRRKEPARTGKAEPRYRVWFVGERGFLYFDLPTLPRVDALWAAEALAAALSEEFDSYTLWDRQTQVLHGMTGQAVLTGDTAVAVSAASQRIVLEAEELAVEHSKVLARSRRLLEATAAMRRIASETGVDPGTPGNPSYGTA